MRAMGVAFKVIVVPVPAMIVRMVVVVRLVVMAGVIVFVAVRVGMFVGMRLPAVVMSVRMSVFVLVHMTMFAVMAMRAVDIEFHPLNVRLARAPDMQVPVLAKLQLAQFSLEFSAVHAEVDHRAEEHVSADAAENIEVKGLHKFKG